MEKKTPLYDEHVKLGGKIVPFGGWLLPVQYPAGILAEHRAVREQCGLFDVSHMGELILTGPDALLNLNNLLTNDFTNMVDEQARYSPMCNENGGTVDDLIVYKKGDNDYFIVVNAANTDKDFNWMTDHLIGDAELVNDSDKWAQLALQGPLAEKILLKLISEDCIPQKNYYAKYDIDINGMNCIVSRTGYTGEDGFELYTDSGNAVALWNLLLETGKDEGLVPCGLGARDTLRLEAAMPLYGHEMDDEVSPRETGLGFFVKMKKDNFIGKKALEEKGDPTVKRVGLKVTGRGIVREHAGVFAGEEKVGHTTSGTFIPSQNAALAMAIIDKAYAEPGTKLEAEVRNKKVEVEVVKLPFYKREK